MRYEKEFFKSWFAAFYRFDGLILMLEVFFDATGSGKDDSVLAVAGFVYDQDGLMAFLEAWEPRVQGLCKAYRTSSCNAGQDAFAGWPCKRRERLINRLAVLSVKHALAGFVVATGKEDYEAVRQVLPEIRELIDSPYALCAANVLAMASSWAFHNFPGKELHYWFECGDTGEHQARVLVDNFITGPETKQHFSNIGSGSWRKKGKGSAFASADLLAWEWRQNALLPKSREQETRWEKEQWSPRMAYIIEKMFDQSKHIEVDYMHGDKATRWALSRLFQGLRSVDD